MKKKNLSIREDKKIGTYVQDSTEISVVSIEEMSKLMRLGSKNR